MKVTVMKTLKWKICKNRTYSRLNSPKKENQNIYNLEVVKYQDYLNIQSVVAVVANESQYHVAMRFYIEMKEYLKVDQIQEVDDRYMIQLIRQMELIYDQ